MVFELQVELVANMCMWLCDVVVCLNGFSVATNYPYKLFNFTNRGATTVLISLTSIFGHKPVLRYCTCFWNEGNLIHTYIISVMIKCLN